MSIIKLGIIFLLFSVISTISALGMKDFLIKLTLSFKNFKIINKISSLVIWFTFTFVFIYVMSIMTKILTLMHIINSKYGVVVVMDLAMLMEIGFLIYALIKIVRKDLYLNIADTKILKIFKFKKWWLNITCLVILSICALILFTYLLFGMEVANQINMNFFTDGLLYFESSAVLANPHSVGYAGFDFSNFSLVDLILKPNNLSNLFQGAWFNFFHVSNHFELKIVYMLCFSYAGWIAFFQSIKVFTNTTWTYIIALLTIVVLFVSFPMDPMWDLYKIRSVMAFTSSILSTSFFLTLIFLAKEFLENKNKLIFIIAPIMYILIKVHVTMAGTYAFMIGLLLIALFIFGIKKLVKHKKIGLKVGMKKVNISVENLVLTSLTLLFVIFLLVCSNYIKGIHLLDTHWCNKVFNHLEFTCELVSDQSYKWKYSFLLIPLFYIVMLFVSKMYLKLLLWISLVFTILLRFKIILMTIVWYDNIIGFPGISFGLKREMVYFITFTLFVTILYLVNIVMKSRYKKSRFLIFLLPIGYMLSWGGFENIKVNMVSTVKDFNVFKLIKSDDRKSDIEFEKFLQKNKIENDTFVVMPKEGLRELWFVKDEFIDTNPIMHRYSEDWRKILDHQSVNKQGKINQYNNVFVAQNQLNNLNEHFYKVFKFKNTSVQKPLGQEEKYYWFIRK